MHYLLFYDYVDNILERRQPFRAAHLGAAWESHDKGELVLGGAYANPVSYTHLCGADRGAAGGLSEKAG